MGDFLLSLTLITKGENLRIAVAAECGGVLDDDRTEKVEAFEFFLFSKTFPQLCFSSRYFAEYGLVFVLHRCYD